MKKILSPANAPALGVLLAILLCSGVIAALIFHTESRSREADSIASVFRAIKSADLATRFRDSHGNVKSDLRSFASRLQAIDCSACPADFRAAEADYCRAIADVAAMNDSTAAALGAVSFLRRDASALEDMHQRNGRAESALLECKRVASQHGVTFSQ